MTGRRWGQRRKSSYSDGGNNCVVIAHDGQMVGVWDSKAAGDPVEVNRTSWQQFVAAMKRR
jgi:hypothetical protein